MGCTQSKFARKRKKKSKYHASYFTEQNETDTESQTEKENRERFSNRKQKSPQNGCKLITSSGKNIRSSPATTGSNDVDDLMTSIGFRENSPEDIGIMRNLMTVEFPRRKHELDFRRRKLYTVFIVAMIVFVHIMRVSRPIHIHA